MKSRAHLVVLLGIVVSHLSSAEQASHATRIQKSIENLGHKDYSVRHQETEKATGIAVSDPATFDEIVRQAKSHSSLEIQKRGEMLSKLGGNARAKELIKRFPDNGENLFYQAKEGEGGLVKQMHLGLASDYFPIRNNLLGTIQLTLFHDGTYLFEYGKRRPNGPRSYDLVGEPVVRRGTWTLRNGQLVLPNLLEVTRIVSKVQSGKKTFSIDIRLINNLDGIGTPSFTLFPTWSSVQPD